MPHQRASILYRVSNLILAQQEQLAELQTRDNGKPLAETRGLVASAAATARYFAAACEVLEGELPTPRSAEVMTLSQYQPMGVIAAITPWNSPIASEMQKVAPALAAGNAVVLKPAEATPLMALKLAELFEQAGLPAGLLSVLPGKGSVIGEALARHPRVKKISFTGGTSTGRHLAHIAADKLIPTSLELGGKSPTIVLEDADLEQAARGICYGIFSSAGRVHRRFAAVRASFAVSAAAGALDRTDGGAAHRQPAGAGRASRPADQRQTSAKRGGLRGAGAAGGRPGGHRRRSAGRSATGER